MILTTQRYFHKTQNNKMKHIVKTIKMHKHKMNINETHETQNENNKHKTHENNINKPTLFFV